ncbi:MAG: alpha/beta hydrolase [Candidatus Nanopelagicales bacterium]|nr:alpha/beta hydrolase [Candidatus Nanopelagicales bacterium]
MLLESDSVIQAPGPWKHREVFANGARFHIVEAGEGPLIVFLHGFPTFWWAWRHQLRTFADAGYHVVAMDLRGYGGSDHTPHGYDPMTLSRDVAAVIRSLGEPSAVVIGQGWGGLIAWSMAVLDPDVVDGIVPVSMPHPRRFRRAVIRDAIQRKQALYAVGFQWPFLPEKFLQEDDCARVGEILRDWSATPGWPDDETALVYRSAFALWPTAHCAVEYHRWALRSLVRTDGVRYASRMDTPIDIPVLHIHGAQDPSVLLRSAEGSGDWVPDSYEFCVLDDVGHFPQEEAPEQFDAVVLAWLAGPRGPNGA